jgi:hypothetical protein
MGYNHSQFYAPLPCGDLIESFVCDINPAIYLHILLVVTIPRLSEYLLSELIALLSIHKPYDINGSLIVLRCLHR